MPYAGGLNIYRKICDNVAEEGYKGFELNSEKVRKTSKPLDFKSSEGFSLGVQTLLPGQSMSLSTWHTDGIKMLNKFFANKW